MPIHEITDISTYQFSKNPVIAKLETDSYIITPGVCAQIKIDASTVDGANAVGGSILFQWATDSVLFTVASSPDDTGCQVREKDVLNDAQYALQLVEDLSKNYKLSENYTIKKTGTSIELTAKIEGSEFSLYDNFHSSSFGYVINATGLRTCSSLFSHHLVQFLWHNLLRRWYDRSYAAGTYWLLVRDPSSAL